MDYSKRKYSIKVFKYAFKKEQKMCRFSGNLVSDELKGAKYKIEYDVSDPDDDPRLLLSYECDGDYKYFYMMVDRYDKLQREIKLESLGV